MSFVPTKDLIIPKMWNPIAQGFIEGRNQEGEEIIYTDYLDLYRKSEFMTICTKKELRDLHSLQGRVQKANCKQLSLFQRISYIIHRIFQIFTGDSSDFFELNKIAARERFTDKMKSVLENRKARVEVKWDEALEAHFAKKESRPQV
jgi:hypothetical protein